MVMDCRCIVIGMMAIIEHVDSISVKLYFAVNDDVWIERRERLVRMDV